MNRKTTRCKHNIITFDISDTIVHRRKTNGENLLIVELKKQNRHSQIDRLHDYKKLKAFTGSSESNSYHFCYGVFILLPTGIMHPRKPEFSWFSCGNEIDV